MQIYVVREGDSLDRIAAAFGASAEEIAYDNQILAPYPLAVGQALLIPGTDSAQQRREVRVNGYAYPYIQGQVLSETLTYLTNLSVFSYGFTTSGNLVPPQADDSWMIGEAWSQGTAPVLVLTPFDQTGMFNNYLISEITHNMTAQQNLIDQMFLVMEEKGFAGIDLDFEYILPQDRVAYADFVANVRAQAAPKGYFVSVALAPKTSADQKGLLYEGKDYRLLGAAADSVLLMTYEWGYTYGPPMAVAPINKVREVVEYAVTEIPVEKIDLGIPNYGYDWTLPFVQGSSRARLIGNVEAVRIAIENDARISFDQTAMSPFFRYERDGVQHEVWFEDVRSIREKFHLITEYGLRGMGYWQIMKLFRANWLLLEDTFDITKIP
ncbi:MAG: LysM peptidoglycan-binding domain-containing protein [Lachnospiraceae bacterium]|jgi:spore germination protein|nr:LysM peptidoglycan-binding domain-containing protein [Lachnospiraceae bacterium]